jgi:c(7)-type cytochrome triheme protein
MALFSKLNSVFTRLWNLIKSRPKLSILVIFLALAIFIFGNIELLHYTTDPQFCKKCHPSDQPGPFGEVVTWEKSKHAKAGVSCVDCHAQPGFIGYMRAKIGGLGDVWAQATKSREHIMHNLKKSADPIYAAQLVKNDICLFCHSDEMNKKTRADRIMTIGISFRTIDGVVNPEFRKKHGLTDVLSEGVRSSDSVNPGHKKHYDRGINCVDCHGNITHNGIAGYKTSMPVCFSCHDIKRKEEKKPPANNDCMACHRDTKKLYPQSPTVYKPKEADPVSFSHQKHLAKAACGDCHSGLWPMEKGKKMIKMDEMYAGKSCGTCHNDKKAFASTECTKCHIEKRK